MPKLTKAERESVQLARANIREIEKAYGKRRAKHANIGWGATEDSIASKVYGMGKNPTVVVTTSRVGRKLYHEHSPYYGG